jgi:hypothetical protein
MAKSDGRRRNKGQPPTGIRPGEKLSEYPRVTMRLPSDVRAELDATAYVLGVPLWRVLLDAIKAYAGSGPGLSDGDRQAIRKALRSRSGRPKP